MYRNMLRFKSHNTSFQLLDFSRPLILVLLWLVSLFMTAPVHGQQPYEPWKIVTASDWHSAENGVKANNPQFFRNAQEREQVLIEQIMAVDPEVVLIAGDMGGGRWVTSSLKNVMKPSETLEQAIYRLGEKTYCNHRRNFLEAGMQNLLVCVGDHDVGDNDWPPGSERSQTVPWHRKIYGQCYNTGAQGQWLWDEKIGDAPARPLGTKYENTSFAHQYKNVLFVNVDVFHQENPDKRLHPQTGSVIANITGKHLEWFDRVLEAGRQQEDIRYIFVQAHPPIITPIRAHSSSMLFVDRYEKSNLWKTMRKHQVDLYFAGEVHSHTISKDPQSDLVQVVTDRKLPVEITVYKDKLEFRAFERDPENQALTEQPNYFQAHHLIIDKSGPSLSFDDGVGVLKELDRQAVFVHYPFEKIETTPFGIEKQGYEPDILNHGELDYFYDGIAYRGEVTEGKTGQAIKLNGNGSVDVYGFCPFGYRQGEPRRTFSLWFNTNQSGQYNLMNGGHGKERRQHSGALDILLQDGTLAIRTEQHQSRGVRQESRVVSSNLNDGAWHHVALVVSSEAQTIGDLKVYLDGQHQSWAPEVIENQKIGLWMDKYHVTFGSTYAPIWRRREASTLTDGGFKGKLDDAAIWYRALSGAEVKALYNLADSKSINLDAGSVDKLFGLYQRGEGTVQIQGNTWKYASGLSGNPGAVNQSNGQVWIRFDSSGKGVMVQK